MQHRLPMEDTMPPFRFSLTSSVIVLVITSSLVAGPPQKGDSKSHQECVVDRHHCHKDHCTHCDAPHAPILGSAPAMLAPVLLARSTTQAVPAREEKLEDELQKLKQLVQVFYWNV